MAEADQANIAAWLFYPGTLDHAPCQWRPEVTLWRAINNEPARQVAVRTFPDDLYYRGGRAVPTWHFRDVDVSAARAPQNKLYFFVTVDGAPGGSNVWAHGADARTDFPRQDQPVGIGRVSEAVEARIDTVWPHGGAPVTEARRANVSGLLLQPGTFLSVPQDFSPRVRLLRALNQGVLEPVAEGTKRLVPGRNLVYPVWDFNNVDVSAAADRANRYYFRLEVEDMLTLSNIWAHGADARTYFPEMDEPTAACQ